MRNSGRFCLVTAMIVAAALLRVVPHPWNFTPVGAIALFGGATFYRRRDRFLVPLLIMLVGDFLLEITTGYGFHSAMPIIYACFAVTVILGGFVRERRSSVGAVGGAAASSATIFFIVTNFWEWLWSPLYAKNLAGLAACYAAGLPFYGNQIAADLLYSALLFGTFVWAERRFPVFQGEAVVR